MKKILLFTLFFLFLPLLVNAASIISIDPIHVIPGETIVTINGSGFGNSSSRKYLYFGYVRIYSLSWSDTKITVKTPYNLYSSRNIKISGSFIINQTCSHGYCHDNTEQQELTSPNFYLKPEITEVSKIIYNNGNFEVTGKYFGDTQGTIKISNENCRIVEWKSNYIKCEIPVIYSNSYSLFYSVKIPESNNYNLTGQVKYLPKISNDSYSFYQTYLKQTGITDVWNKYSGKGINIAVIDSGIDINNPDLKYSLWINYKELLNNKIDDDQNGYIDDYYGYNFIDNNSDMSPKSSHGTMVAGIISASRDNNLGIAGIAPNSKVMSLIACNNYGCPEKSVKNAIKYAVDNGVDIINLSLGGNGSLGYSPSYRDVLKYAYEKDVLIIASAGNGDTEGNGTRGQDMDRVKASPVCNEDNSNIILGVGAVDKNNKPTVWTNYSMNYVDISAPGIDIFSTVVPFYNDNNWYAFKSGTSFSAPIVTGIASLLKEKNPSWKNVDLMSQIVSRSDNFPNNWNVYGNLINAKNIIESHNPQAEFSSISPKIIDENSQLLHIYGDNFYNNIKIKFYSKQLSGYIPVSIMNISKGEIIVDFSKWEILSKFPGLFSLKINSSDNSYINKNKYILSDAVEVKKIFQTKFDEQKVEKDGSIIIDSQQEKDLNLYIENEKEKLTRVDIVLSNKLSGRILLQVEDHGEAWYVNSKTNKRHYMANGQEAYSIMRKLGIGITNTDLDKVKGDKNLAKKHSGKIFLQVKDLGQAYYIDFDGNAHYLKNGAEAYSIMRKLGLGIKNNDIQKIEIN